MAEEYLRFKQADKPDQENSDMFGISCSAGDGRRLQSKRSTIVANNTNCKSAGG